ncbi:MAG: HAD family hydrolase [Phycisphaerae bacterium]|nr:HAD family hydrolase [Phycisphaerae bacterium]
MLFDLGETLLEFGRVDVWRMFQEAANSSYAYLQEQGQPVRGLGGYKWASFLLIRLKLLVSDWTGRDWDSLALLRRIGERGGYDLTEEQLRELNWRWYEPLGRRAKAEPDLAETLARLRDAGLRLGIVSNTWVNGDALERHLEQLGVLGFFEVRIYSCSYRFRKPDRRLFRKATEELGVLPGHVMFVGDRLDTDVRGALNAGMVPVLKLAYTNARKRAPAGVERIEKLSELPRLIERFNAAASTS